MAPSKAGINLLPFVLMIFVCSCAQISPQPAVGPPGTRATQPGPETNPPVRVPIRDLDNANNIEIIWQAPDDRAEAFVIRYGTNPDVLSEEKRVNASTIEKFNDRDFGLVYRYVLRDMPKGSDIFFSVASVHGSAISEPSPVFEVKAEEAAGASPKNTEEPPVL